MLAAPFYIGCYRDDSSRKLPAYFDHPGSSYLSCYTPTSNAGYRFFGVEAGNECWGGSDIALAVSLGAATGCGACASGGGECGGGWLVSVYGPPRVFAGCYLDNASRMLPNSERRARARAAKRRTPRMRRS